MWSKTRSTKSIELFTTRQLSWRKWLSNIKVKWLDTDKKSPFYFRWCQGNISTRYFTYQPVGTSQAANLLPVDRRCANKVSVVCFCWINWLFDHSEWTCWRITIKWKRKRRVGDESARHALARRRKWSRSAVNKCRRSKCHHFAHSRLVSATE